MITSFEYFDGKIYIACSLITRIGDDAIILIRGEKGLPIKLKVKFNLIKVSSKHRIHN